MPEYDLAHWKRWQASTGASRADAASKEVSLKKAARKRPAPRPKALSSCSKGCRFPQAPRFLATGMPMPSASAPLVVQKRRAPLRVPGGAMSQARRGADGSALKTDGPGPGEYGAPADVQQTLRGGVIPSAARWHDSECEAHASSSGGVVAYGSGHEDLATRRQGPRCTLKSREPRIPEDPIARELAETPGPGKYKVNPIRDERSAIIGPPANSSSKAQIQDACAREAMRYQLRVPLGSYGYGHACRVKEHVRFGQCRDAKCSQRAAWERRGQRPTPDADHLPVAQYALLDLDGVRKSDESLLSTLCSLDLSERDYLGRTALQALAAAQFEAEDRQVRKAELLRMAAERTGQSLELDAQDCDGNTALHLAVSTEQASLVDWLVRQGADPELENCAEQTALHLACELHGHQRIYQLLQAAISMLDMHAEITRIENDQRAIYSRLSTLETPLTQLDRLRTASTRTGTRASTTSRSLSTPMCRTISSQSLATPLDSVRGDLQSRATMSRAGGV